MTVYLVPVGPGRMIRFAGPFPLTGAEWDQFLALLEVFRPGLVAEQVTPPAATG